MSFHLSSLVKAVVPESPASAASIRLVPLTRTFDTARLQAVHESVLSLNERFSWCSLPYGKAQNKHYIRQAEHALFENRGLYFAIVQSETQRFLGEVIIDWVSPDGTQINIAYWIRHSERNKGYATLALRSLLMLAAQYLPVEQAHLAMETDNYASRRVAQKTGSRYTHLIRNGATHRPVPADTYCFKYSFYKTNAS